MRCEVNISLQRSSSEFTRAAPSTCRDEFRFGYHKLKPIGSGASAVVYEAYSVARKELVALKVLRTAFLDDREARLRFEREARLGCRVRSPHVVEYHALESSPGRGRPYIVMERLRGQTLHQRLAGTPVLSVDDAVGHALQVAEGLKGAHAQGIVHRDLKPANVFLHHGAPNPALAPILKVMDFGIAKRSIDLQITQSDTILGTARYMSPEQLFGGSVVDTRSDLWSLGVMLYQMLSGALPFDDPNIARLNNAILSEEPPDIQLKCPWLQAELVLIVRRLLSKAPEDRFASVEELQAALRRVHDGPPTLQFRR